MKRVFKLLVVFIIFISLTGCVKMDMEMKINKDKSMNLTIIESFDTEIIGDMDTSQMYSVSEFEAKGFYAEKFEEKGKKGYKYTKSIPSIDEISTFAELETLDLEKSLTEDEQVIFHREKGFIKDKYSASFKYDNKDIKNLEKMSFGKDDEYNENCLYEYDGDMLSVNCITDDIEINQEENKKVYDKYIKDKKNKVKKLNESMELNFKLKIPYKSRSNNATSKSGKTLTWDLTKTQDINFEFEIYNMNNVYKTIGIFVVGIGIIVAAVLVIIKLKKQTPPTNNNQNNQYSNSNLNNTDYNQSTNFPNIDIQPEEANNQSINYSNFNWQEQNSNALNTVQEITPVQPSSFISNQSINQSSSNIESSSFTNNNQQTFNNFQQVNPNTIENIPQNNQSNPPINEVNISGNNNQEQQRKDPPHIDIPPMV